MELSVRTGSAVVMLRMRTAADLLLRDQQQAAGSHAHFLLSIKGYVRIKLL